MSALTAMPVCGVRLGRPWAKSWPRVKCRSPLKSFTTACLLASRTDPIMQTQNEEKNISNPIERFYRLSPTSHPSTLSEPSGEGWTAVFFGEDTMKFYQFYSSKKCTQVHHYVSRSTIDSQTKECVKLYGGSWKYPGLWKTQNRKTDLPLGMMREIVKTWIFTPMHTQRCNSARRGKTPLWQELWGWIGYMLLSKENM